MRMKMKMKPRYETMPPCQVCSNPEARPAFYSVVCSACRMFFGRHSGDQFIVKCPYFGECIIHYKSLRLQFCSACRLKKCFEAKMTTDEEGGSVVGSLYLTSHGHSPMRKLLDMYERTKDSGCNIMRNGKMSNRLKWIDVVVELDNQILVPNGPSPSTAVAKTDIVLTELLLIPETCIDRTTTVCDGFSYTTLPAPYKIAESFCRVFVAAVDWMKLIEDFDILPINDKLKLLQQNALMISIYLIYSFKYSKGWDLSTIFEYLDRFQLPNVKNAWASAIKSLIQTHLGDDKLEEIQPTEKEFMLLRIRSLFRPCIDHSAKGYPAILRARLTLTHRLAEHVRQTTPDISSVGKRLASLLALDHRLQDIGKGLNSVMPALMTQAGPVPPLFHDIFIRQF